MAFCLSLVIALCQLLYMYLLCNVIFRAQEHFSRHGTKVASYSGNMRPPTLDERRDGIFRFIPRILRDSSKCEMEQELSFQNVVPNLVK